MRYRLKGVMTALFVFEIINGTAVSASPVREDLHSSPFFKHYLAKFFSSSDFTDATAKANSAATKTWREQPSKSSYYTAGLRRTLADAEGDEEDGEDGAEDVNVSGMSAANLREKISDHRVRLIRLKQEAKDLAHEKAFLLKSLELKKGQKTMQDGQVKLSMAELEDKAKEIEMYKREAPRTLAKYNELVRKQKKMQETLNKLHQESEELTTSKGIILEKIQNLNMEDIIERHARALPEAMAGALRKSAAALTPFFDYLVIAADTNNRLVDHVGAEIDKYTHVNITKSPFMSGVLFYCVVLIPLLTVISFVRRIFDTSSKLTVSHYIIFGNLYFIVICLANIVASFFLHEDPMSVLFRRFEKTFIIGNLILSTYYAWHLIMLGLQALYTCENRNVAQFLATLSVGIHYFLFAWRRIFTDSAPLMYSVNYLVYVTIFCFILYERYHRMSSRQLNESTLFKLFQIILKRRQHLTSIRSFKILFSELRASIHPVRDEEQRRLTRQKDRPRSVEKIRSKLDLKKKATCNRKKPFSSDDSDTELRTNRKQDAKAPYERKNKLRSRQRPLVEAEPPGFISIFFGAPEIGDDSSDNGDEIPPTSKWGLWGMGRKQDRSIVQEATKHTTISQPRRSGHSHRSNRTKVRKEAPPSQASLWKWS